MEKCLSNFIFFPCLLLPSSSFAYGFAPDLIACWSPCWVTCPGHSGLASLSASALTRQQALCGKLITMKSWHFQISTVGTSHQQELLPRPHLRPKHNDLQKRGRVSWSGCALRAGILDVCSRLIRVTLLWNTVLTWTVELPAARSSCHLTGRSNRLISYFF